VLGYPAVPLLSITTRRKSAWVMRDVYGTVKSVLAGPPVHSTVSSVHHARCKRDSRENTPAITSNTAASAAYVTGNPTASLRTYPMEGPSAAPTSCAVA